MVIGHVFCLLFAASSYVFNQIIFSVEDCILFPGYLVIHITSHFHSTNLWKTVINLSRSREFIKYSMPSQISILHFLLMGSLIRHYFIIINSIISIVVYIQVKHHISYQFQVLNMFSFLFQRFEQYNFFSYFFH